MSFEVQFNRCVTIFAGLAGAFSASLVAKKGNQCFHKKTSQCELLATSPTPSGGLLQKATMSSHQAPLVIEENTSTEQTHMQFFQGSNQQSGGASMEGAASGTVWPSGYIPFWIDDVNDDDNAAADGYSGVFSPTNAAILGGIRNWEQKTCLRFHQCATRQECRDIGSHLRFRHSFQPAYDRRGAGSACHANMGMNSGETLIALPDWCIRCDSTKACPGPNCAESTQPCNRPDIGTYITDEQGITWYTGGVEHEIGHTLTMMHTVDRTAGVRDDMWFKVNVAGNGVDVGPFNPGDNSIMFGSGFISPRDVEFISFMYGDCSNDARLACTTTIDDASPAASAGRLYPLEIAVRSRDTPSEDIQIELPGADPSWLVQKQQNKHYDGWMNYAGVRIDLPLGASSVGQRITVTARFVTQTDSVECSAVISPVDPCTLINCVNGVCQWPGVCLCNAGWVGEFCDQQQSVLEKYHALRQGHYCRNYGYRGNRHIGDDLNHAIELCDSDVNCGGIAQWECGTQRWNLCGYPAAGQSFSSNWGGSRCSMEKRPAKDVEYEPLREGYYCAKYAYRGNSHIGETESHAKELCDADAQCAGIAQWVCGTASWNLCGYPDPGNSFYKVFSGNTQCAMAKRNEGIEASKAENCAIAALTDKSSHSSNAITMCSGAGSPNSCHNCAKTASPWMCADCLKHCGEDVCANINEVLNIQWVEKAGHCTTYGYNMNAGRDLSVAQFMCAGDPKCAAVGDWGCNGQYLLCGAENYQFTTMYGTGHCLREISSVSGQPLQWTGPCAQFHAYGPSVCNTMNGCLWTDEMCNEASKPTPSSTLEPTPKLTPRPTLQPTLDPTVEPTPQSTLEPTPKLTPRPTLQPTLDPAVEPTPQSTLEPTPQRTPEPTLEPPWWTNSFGIFGSN